MTTDDVRAELAAMEAHVTETARHQRGVGLAIAALTGARRPRGQALLRLSELLQAGETLRARQDALRAQCASVREILDALDAGANP